MVGFKISHISFEENVKSLALLLHFYSRSSANVADSLLDGLESTGNATDFIHALLCAAAAT